MGSTSRLNTLPTVPHHERASPLRIYSAFCRESRLPSSARNRKSANVGIGGTLRDDGDENELELGGAKLCGEGKSLPACRFSLFCPAGRTPDGSMTLRACAITHGHVRREKWSCISRSRVSILQSVSLAVFHHAATFEFDGRVEVVVASFASTSQSTISSESPIAAVPAAVSGRSISISASVTVAPATRVPLVVATRTRLVALLVVVQSPDPIVVVLIWQAPASPFVRSFAYMA